MQHRRFPLIDEDFAKALRGGDDDAWASVLLDTSGNWIREHNRPAVVELAWLAERLGDRPLAESLLQRALDGMWGSENEGVVTCLVAIDYLRSDEHPRTSAVARQVLELVDGLLKQAKFAEIPSLWRLGSELAHECGNESRSVACLEKALDLEGAGVPDLSQFQLEHVRLLRYYLSLASTSRDLKSNVPGDLAARVIHAADRWRAADPGNAEPSDLAAAILADLDLSDLAWDYLTTQYAASGRTLSAWSTSEDRHNGLLQRPAIAERVLAVASEEFPEDLEILRDRAKNLKSLGRMDEAKAVLRQMISMKRPKEGQEWYRRWAKEELEGR
jgi:hypothetical protein